MSAIDVGAVSRTMRHYLEQQGIAVTYHDHATAKDVPLSTNAAAAPDGLLPALIIAGEAVWRAETGHGFAVKVSKDRDALFGYRLDAIEVGQFSLVMLSAMEAGHQVTRDGVLEAGGLHGIWFLANEMERRVKARPASEREPARPGTGASP